MSGERNLREQMKEMEDFYVKKLNDTRSKLQMAEEELRYFKDRMAEVLAVSLDTAPDTENMNSPVNLSRLQEMYHLLRVNKWPKVKGQVRKEGQTSEGGRIIIQRVFKEAVTYTDSLQKPFYAIFTENMSQKELPKNVQDHLRCSLDNLQLALFHSNKEGLCSAAVMEAPEASRKFWSECYWLFCLMALSKTPVQPDWDKLSKDDQWECFPPELKQFTREDGQHQQNSLESVFIELEGDIVKYVKQQLKRFYSLLTSERSSEDPESTSGGDESSREAVLNIVLDFLRRMDQQQKAERLWKLTTTDRQINMSLCCNKLKSSLRQTCEGVVTAGNSVLQQIYTEECVTEGGSSESYKDQNTKQIKSTSSQIPLEDLFKQQPKSVEKIRTVLTVGVAGMGKTLLTQTFTLDWVEGRSHQDVQLLFPFTFRELSKQNNKKYNLVELIHSFFRDTEELCNFEDLQLLFILDGLDECRLPLDFSQTRVLTEPTESASVEELLVNLIRGKLLPSARLWITTRPEAADKIPAECVSMRTHVQGFTKTQKEEYFRKTLSERAKDIISHINTNSSLSVMCRNPGFCSIISKIQLKNQELPLTLTNVYIHFLRENSVAVRNANLEVLLSVGKLVFDQLNKQKENQSFNEFDLRDCDLYDSQIVCLRNTNVPEFLAALYVHHTFFSGKENLLSLLHKASQSDTSFYRSAVDRALKSSNGHLDMLLRFLLGLSLSTNQKLLSGLLTETRGKTDNHEIVVYINKKLNEESVSVERRLNLLHCLNELNDHSLTKEIQKMLKEGSLGDGKMSSAQWTALSFLLLSSDSDLEEFDLKKFCPSEEGLEKLLMVVKASRKANLSFCDLKLQSTKHLVSVLNSSSLTHLYLNNNDIQDTGVNELCQGLKSATCRLTTLSLSSCGLTCTSCAFLASVLNSSSLTHLYLSNNDIQDTGVNELCQGLKSATCRLTTLSLSCCGLTYTSCAFLASVLNSSSLTHLDLSNNDIQDTGVERLCEGLKSAPCRLETLRLSGCMVSESSGAFLASAVTTALCDLKELDLSYNAPGTSLQCLDTLQVPNGPLSRLKLEPAGVHFLATGLTKYSCELSMDPKTAKGQLQLSNNNRTVAPKDSDKRQILCLPALTDRCYWEVEYEMKPKSSVCIAVVTYSGKRDSDFCKSPHSWTLKITRKKYTVYHNGKSKQVQGHSSPQSYPARVAVYLDNEAGYLSFYTKDTETLVHLHTFHITFSEPVFAGFRLQTCKLSLVDGRAKDRSRGLSSQSF